MKTGIKIIHNKLLGGWYVVRGCGKEVTYACSEQTCVPVK